MNSHPNNGMCISQWSETIVNNLSNIVERVLKTKLKVNTVGTPREEGRHSQKRKECGLGDKRQEHPLAMNLRMPVRVCKPNYPDLCPYLFASLFALPQNN